MNNYVVSARKYRPATFDSVVGQHALTTTLKNAIAQGKLAHAYLFCGPRGVGKTTCARIFAKTINCLSPTPQGEACNECESCRAFNEQRSYNIHELDAASNNSVDDIRELIEQVQIPPQIGRYKVFIIDEVHMLSAAAFNAFLKTLEEPPAHAIFILATTEKHKILPTILSRCQIYDFNRITVTDTVEHLKYVADKEGIRYEPEALHVIAEKADGGMRDALSIFDQVASFCEGNITYDKVIEDLNVLDYDQYFAMTDLLLKGDIPGAMVQLNDILSKGFEGNYFIGGLAAHFRNLLMSRDAQTLPLLDVSERVRQRYHEQAGHCPPKLLYRALKLCNDCDLNYRTSRNKRLLVELTLIETAQAATGDDEAGCGRRPTHILSPIFSKVAATPPTTQAQTKPAAAAQPATTTTTPPPAHPVPQKPQADTAATTTTPATASPEQDESEQIRAKTAAFLSSIGQNKPKRIVRPVETLSIRELQERARRELEESHHKAKQAAAAKAEVEQKPEDQRLATPFTTDSLMYYWFRFAQQLPREKSAIAGRLKGITPVLHEDWSIGVLVDNDMVEQYIHDLQIDLTNYLRINLRNDYIRLQVKVAEGVATRRAFSRREQFKDMLSRSRELRMLSKELELELA